ncbi:MAG TPA: ATP-binding protein [Polyangiaceae bacterium]|jgi:PAS domain S-box-containing protein|nr:ATP-binding protein [Polyangiaceae bacterium]
MVGSIPLRPGTRGPLLAAAAGLVVVLVLLAWAARSYVAAVDSVDHTLNVQKTANEWLTGLFDSREAARAYAAGSEPRFLAAYEAGGMRARMNADAVRALVADDPVQVRNVEATDRVSHRAFELSEELVALTNAGHRAEALERLTSDESRGIAIEFRADIRRIHLEEERVLFERREEARHRSIEAAASGALLVAASIALLIYAWRTERTRDRLLDQLAAETRARLAMLTDLAVALSEARTRSDVAQVIVEHGARAARADTCTLYLLDESGMALELLGDRGVAPALLDKIRRISRTSGNPETFEMFEAQKTVWAENEADYAALYPRLATLKVEGPRAKAFWSIPLVVEGNSLGLLGMGFYQPRKFSSDERAFVETLARQSAQALLRAARLESEDEARRWFTTTLKSIGDAVIATDPEGRVTFMNQVAERLTGWTESEADGRHLDEVFRIFSEVTGAPVESPVEKVLREGTVVGLANHTVLRSRNGTDVPIDDSGAPIRTETGNLAGVVLVFRDVSLEKVHASRREFLAKAGEALVSSLDYEATLSTVARLAVPILADWCSLEVVESDADTPRLAVVAHVDPSKVAFARDLRDRYPPDSKAPQGVPEVIRTGRPELYTEIPAALLEGAAQDAEHLRLIRELMLRSAMIVPLRTATRTFGAMTFVYAESGRRYTEDDLAFALDFARRAAMAIENAASVKELSDARTREGLLRHEAEVAGRAKDEFLAVVSHELRTPLTAILGWAVTLRNRKSADELERGLAVIERNARSQAKLIEDVLDVSRIISGKLSLNLAPTNVADAVAASIETVTPAAKAKDITVTSTVTTEALTITADPDRLQQIVWNLLSNAVKFTPKGGQVWLTSERQGSDVVIVVRDSGEGISAEALPLVFEPFHQADASTTRRHGGLGLGLAIVKQLVTAQGGTVTAESGGVGKGATFTVRIPARSAVPPLAWTARPTAALETAAASTSGVTRLDGLKLLVVDDEEDTLELMSRVLRDRGAEVHVAASAGEAIETFSSARPDVIVSDVGMPGMDGYALIRKIRSLSLESGGRTPAVALTAYARNEDVQRAFAAGYQMHLAKPVDPSHLVTVVLNLGGRSVDEG